jgi:hypothetical protein
MHKSLAAAAFVSLCAATIAMGQEDPLRASASALRARLAAQASRPAAGGPETVTSCVNQIACGQTIQAALVPACQVDGGNAIDLFQFTGAAGQTVTITASSADFAPFLDLEEPVTFASAATGEGTLTSPAVASATLDADGTWSLGATNFGDAFQAGDYTLSLACSGTGSNPNPNCSPDGSTLCLASGRFKVTATFDAGASGAGQAHAVTLTDDTGYLWFFDPTNVEAVVKVLDGCDLDGYHWVFAGGLTNVNVVMTVIDTQSGARKRYVNPANTTFLPIQDTGAFPACP